MTYITVSYLYSTMQPSTTHVHINYRLAGMIHLGEQSSDRPNDQVTIM